MPLPLSPVVPPELAPPRARAHFAAGALFLLFGIVGPASAAEGIFLNWTDCALGAAATTDQGSDCLSNAGQSELVCSFSLAQPVDSVLAVEITIDIQHSQAALPAWWHFESVPCRGGSLRVDSDFSAHSACSDMWNGEPTAGGLAQYTIGLPHGLASQARIKLALAVTPDRMQSLGATSTYYAARLLIDNLQKLDETLQMVGVAGQR